MLLWTLVYYALIPHLRDAPIGASTVQYLDSSPSNKWVASTHSKRPAGCRFTDAVFGAPATPESRALDGIRTRDECCTRCWAEGLCAVALFAADGQRCLLQTADEAATASSSTVEEQTSSWTRCERARGGTLELSVPATVPGDLLTDLQAAGQIGDPWYEKTFLNSSLWNDHVWNTSTSFAAAAGVRAHADAGGQVLLVFDGIKMGAHLSLDGTALGTADDQFLRYSYDVTALLAGPGADATHTLSVSFDPAIHVDGRFAACTGGWDWAPYSHTYLDGAHTFSKGVWKSVYLAASAPSSVAITHLVPQITYEGAYPTSKLVDGKHAGFAVALRVHLFAKAATRGTLTLSPAWRPGKVSVQHLAVPQGESNATLLTSASAREIGLWWPNGVGDDTRPLYNVTVSFTPSAHASRGGVSARGAPAKVTATRTVGFRYVALVTGNDTDPWYVINASGQEGTSRHGLYLRVNGVPIFSKGANVIPMEELEGRLDASAHVAMVAAAVGGGFNMLRVWGGGMFLPDAFYDACDSMGLLVYHDMQYAQSGHAPKASATQAAELRHAIRRLSAHASIAVWDGCNECQVVVGTPTGIYATFVMTVVAQEDASRAVWPSCPALGWTSGVHALDSRPNGKPLLTPSHLKTRQIETHGPYLHGSGFPAVNGDPKLSLFKPLVPIKVKPDVPTGLGVTNVFASEFGAAVMSSFESMAPTLAPEHWGLHAGQPDDTCPGGFERHCEGVNVMAERNYPCDNLIDVYFGTQPDGYFNQTGEGVFKKQLYQCMVAQAIHMTGDISARRGLNQLGLLVWQFNEIWPTGGWGSIEYGTPVAGQVLGGRWKPLQYLYRRFLFADVLCSCGADGWCFVKNDQPGEPFKGELVIGAVAFATGNWTALASKPLQMAAGPGVSERFQLDLGGVAGSTHLLLATVSQGKENISANEILLAPPKDLALPAATVTAAVAAGANADGSVDVHLAASATALYVVLTTLAHGRFSDNAFAMVPGGRTVQFVPLAGEAVDVETLRLSLRVEHMQQML